MGLASTIVNRTADVLGRYSVSWVSEYKSLELPSSENLSISIFTKSLGQTTLHRLPAEHRKRNSMIFMNTLTVSSILAALLATVNAAAVRGKPKGFGSKASGGVAGPKVTPSTNAQLQQYLSQRALL